jgi:hypothetical protein
LIFTGSIFNPNASISFEGASPISIPEKAL